MIDSAATETTERVPGGMPPASAPLRTMIEAALRGHRDAMMAGDVDAIARWTEELSRLLPGLEAVSGQSAGVSTRHRPGATGTGVPADALSAVARGLREAVQLNQTLAHNGLVIAHHFAAAVAESARPAGESADDDPALFAGVA
jgi:hypothetical protein